MVNQTVGSTSQAKKAANEASDKGKKEVNELSARAKEASRREARQEGWRSEAFDV